MKCWKRFCLLSCLLIYSQLSVAELRDPTRPDDYVDKNTEISSNSLDLSEIIISPQRRIAIINGQAVKEGDQIAGIKVLTIRENSVELESAASKMTLYLISSPVKSPTN